MKNKTLIEEIIEKKREIYFVLLFLLISLSLFTIGYVIYRFFFWQPPVEVLPFQVNFSNLTQWEK